MNRVRALCIFCLHTTTASASTRACAPLRMLGVAAAIVTCVGGIVWVSHSPTKGRQYPSNGPVPTRSATNLRPPVSPKEQPASLAVEVSVTPDKLPYEYDMTTPTCAERVRSRGALSVLDRSCWQGLMCTVGQRAASAATYKYLDNAVFIITG